MSIKVDTHVMATKHSSLQVCLLLNFDYFEHQEPKNKNEKGTKDKLSELWMKLEAGK